MQQVEVPVPLQGRGPVRCDLGLKSLQLEIDADTVGNVCFILDDQYARMVHDSISFSISSISM